MIRALPALLCIAIIASLHPYASAQEPADASVWIESYDIVWQTVNEHHFDPTFGGLDWNEIHDRYYDRVKNAKDDPEFIKTVNEMLGELKLSHYAVFHMREKAASGSPITSSGTVGLGIRLLDDRAVVTWVKSDFPAAEAGLRIGYIVESIDSIPVERIVAEIESEALPTANERRRLSDTSDELNRRLFGDAGTPVSLEFLDESDVLHETTLLRKQQAGKTIIGESFPPLYVDFHAKRLEGNIGYVSFSAFVPPVDERFGAALDSLLDVRGLIIDIRGNPGGMHEVGEAIVSRLIRKDTLFSIFRYRDETQEVIVQPGESTYDGPVVILIDVMNASASERFSGCIQSIGRAVVVGERSSGSVGPSDVMELPNGASFMYLVAQSLTPDGMVLEGHGVIPDISTGLDRATLLEGRDVQLERAIAYIKNETR